MKTIIKTLLCLVAILTTSAISYAGNVIGIKADGEATVFELDSVVSIKASRSGLISVNSKNGEKSIGYRSIKFSGEFGNGLKANNAESVVRVYPNPVQKVLYLVGADAETEITIVDLYGRVVKNEKGESIDVESLSGGLYILIAGGKKVKFIKE